MLVIIFIFIEKTNCNTKFTKTIFNNMKTENRHSEAFWSKLNWVYIFLLLFIVLPVQVMGSWPNLRDRDVARQQELRRRISEIRRERPRIFMTSDEIEAVKVRLAENSSSGEVYQWLRQWAYGGQYYHNLWVAPKKLQGLVVVYRLEGKPQKILNECIRCMDFLCSAKPDSWTYPRAVRGLSMAYDWLYDDLTDAQKQKYGKKIIEYSKACYDTWKHSELNNHVYLEYGPVLYAGIALLDEGIDDEAVEQLLLDGMQLLLDQFIPAHEQLAKDGGWYESMSYHSFFTLEYAHLLELWQQASGEQVWQGPGGLQGDADWLVYNARPWDDSRVHVADLGDNSSYDLANSWYLPLLWKHHRDGVARYWTDYIKNHTQDPVNRGYMWWPYVVWGDESVPAVEREELPLASHFRGTGWVSTRSSWDEDASFGLFVCSDWWGGHQHCDNNSFTIHKKAPLIIDSGIYDAGPHRANYSARSIAHNTITVYNPNEKFFGGTWGQSNSDPTVNDGGQLYTPSPSGVEACAPGTKYDRGDIISYKHTPEYTYTAGDATKSYSSSKMKEFKRAFIHFRPDLFVVFDRVESTDSSFIKRWLLHSVNEPVIDVDKITIVNGSGNVTCQTVYPVNVGKIAIGGPGREFEVNGTNFPSSVNDPEAGAWRVEISPQTFRKRDYFLHVLRTAESSPVAPEVELLEKEDSLGVRITDDGQTYEVYFTTGGELKSRIHITDSLGKTIVDDRIASLLPKVLQHPKDVTVEPDAHAKFFIKDRNADDFRWQVNAGAGYIDILDDEIYSGSNNDTLWIENAPLGFSKNKYRCIISNSSDSFSTNEAVLTVEEKEAPEITSSHPDRVLQADNNCQTILPDFTGDVTATDNYTVSPVISQHPEAGSFIEGSDNLISLTATDESGNSTTVTFNVEVADSIKPVVTCAENANLVISGNEQVYRVTGTELDPLSTGDNCEVLTVLNDYTQTSTLQLAEFPAGTSTVTWTASDAAGNQEQCSQEITVSQYVGVETNRQSGIKVYPNPTKGKMYIESFNHRILCIKVSDMTGKICMVRNSFRQNGFLDLSQFVNGIYHIAITTSNNLFVYKIVLAG